MRYIYLFLVLAAYLVMILVMGWDGYRAFWSDHKVLWAIIDCSVLLPFLLFGSTNEHEKQKLNTGQDIRIRAIVTSAPNTNVLYKYYVKRR